jgi:hypothetical protein
MITRKLATKLAAKPAALVGVAIVGFGVTSQAVLAQKAAVVELTQTPCQFIESENGIDHGFTSTKKADCESINSRSGAKRLAKAKVMQLAPGKYVFRVTNKNVPYPLGFWLRGDGLVSRIRLPSVSGGGLVLGKTQDYSIELKEGEYVYSCPLNTTPDYKLIVRN